METKTTKKVNKTASMNIRINPNVKSDVEQILRELGITPSDAISLFFNQVRLHHKIPFEISCPHSHIPNAETMKAIEDYENGIDKGVAFNTLDEMWEDLDA